MPSETLCSLEIDEHIASFPIVHVLSCSACQHQPPQIRVTLISLNIRMYGASDVHIPHRSTRCGRSFGVTHPETLRCCRQNQPQFVHIRVEDEVRSEYLFVVFIRTLIVSGIPVCYSNSTHYDVRSRPKQGYTVLI